MTIDVKSLVTRPLQAARMISSIEKHLTEDQEDALAGAGFDRDGTRTNAEPDGSNPIAYSDPTGTLAGVLSPFSNKVRRIQKAVDKVDEALNKLEAACTAAISDRAVPEDVPLCPGWNVELRSRLGGCGEQLETYRLASGEERIRSSWLCVKCRKADDRAKRDQAEEAA